MKFAIGTILFFWLLAGLIGAAMLGKLNLRHWDAIAGGPITLHKAFSDSPPNLPGP
jgi:hypothetical protein